MEDDEDAGGEKGLEQEKSASEAGQAREREVGDRAALDQDIEGGAARQPGRAGTTSLTEPGQETEGPQAATTRQPGLKRPKTEYH